MVLDHGFADVLIRARRKESEAFSVLYCRYLPAISSYIAGYIHDHSTAEDLTSEVFLKMIESIGKSRAKDEATFRAWLYRIAKNTVAGYYRKRGRMPEFATLDCASELQSLCSTGNPVQHLEKQEDMRALVEELGNITEEQRQVLAGRYELDYDAATIAMHLGKSADAVRALQHRALQRLRHNLAARILAILILLGSILGTTYALVRAAQPGSPLYPVKQWSQQQMHHSSRLAKPHAILAPMPTPTQQAQPTTTKSADELESTGKQSSTPVPTTTTTSSTATPTASSTPVLSVNATVTLLPTATPLACLLKVCV